jgi:3-methyladenine DNA glycosylase/8-oxoguanine DNA glycosylase
VGSWTAHWLLIRALGHPDGFPGGDLALARTVSRLYGLDHTMSPAELEEFSQRWAPYRGYVTLYLFAASRMGLLESAVAG